jgi:hypothetical protein
MRQDKLHLNEWSGRLLDELESEESPRYPLLAVTAKLGLKNWLIYRAMRAEPKHSSASASRFLIFPKRQHSSDKRSE